MFAPYTWKLKVFPIIRYCVLYLLRKDLLNFLLLRCKGEINYDHEYLDQNNPMYTFYLSAKVQNTFMEKLP